MMDFKWFQIALVSIALTACSKEASVSQAKRSIASIIEEVETVEPPQVVDEKPEAAEEVESVIEEISETDETETTIETVSSPEDSPQVVDSNPPIETPTNDTEKTDEDESSSTDVVQEADDDEVVVAEEEPAVEEPVAEEPKEEVVVSEDSPNEDSNDKTSDEVATEDPTQEPEAVVVIEDQVEEPTEEEEAPVLCVKRDHYTLSEVKGDQVTVLGEVTPYLGSVPADVNYNYYSWSAHPILGSQPKAFEGKFFLYNSGEKTAFNFLYNIDRGGSKNNKVNMQISISGNRLQDQILISDDRAEVRRSEKGQISKYSVKMQYWKNTDGGSIGPIDSEDLKLDFNTGNIGDNKVLEFSSREGKVIFLNAFSNYRLSYEGEKEDCSTENIVEEQKNQCIRTEYEVVREEIEAAKWHKKYEEILSQRREIINKQVVEHKKDLEEKTESYESEIERLKEKIMEVESQISIEEESIKEKYIDLQEKIIKTYEEENLKTIREFDVALANLKNSKKKSCKKKSFLKKLFCKIIKFIKKVISKVVNFVKGILRSLGIKIGKKVGSVKTAADVIALKKETLNQILLKKEIQLEELENKKIVELEELKVKTEKTVTSLEVQIESVLEQKNEELSKLVAVQNKEIKTLKETSLKDIKSQRAVWVKEQARVHKFFETAIEKCF